MGHPACTCDSLEAVRYGGRRQSLAHPLGEQRRHPGVLAGIGERLLWIVGHRGRAAGSLERGRGLIERSSAPRPGGQQVLVTLIVQIAWGKSIAPTADRMRLAKLNPVADDPGAKDERKSRQVSSGKPAAAAPRG